MAPSVPRQGTEKKAAKERRKPKPRQKQAKNKNLEIHREETLTVVQTILPPNAEFKGYEDVVVQATKGRLFRADNVRFRKEKYWAPSLGQTFLASLPHGYEGEFGPGLKALSVTLYSGVG